MARRWNLQVWWREVHKDLEEIEAVFFNANSITRLSSANREKTDEKLHSDQGDVLFLEEKKNVGRQGRRKRWGEKDK